jgi:hypothetical protein
LAELMKDIKACTKVVSKPSLLQRLPPAFAARTAPPQRSVRGGNKSHELQR